MKYISVKEAAKKFGINERRVRALLKEKRIEGAIYKDHKYLIPESAVKPLDRRVKGQRLFEDSPLKGIDIDFKNYRKQYPSDDGYFGRYGGTFLPDNLKKAMEEIYYGYQTIAKSSKFVAELREIRKNYHTQNKLFFLASMFYLTPYILKISFKKSLRCTVLSFTFILQ